jgi:(1->4)-alpha-D-glucan 1-alpha-D-glucosylmutase
MRIPEATYRLQFNRSFGFKAAEGIVPYLADLGISDLYASPIFKARKESSHGYDVVDPNRLNAELGTENHFETLIVTIKNHGIEWLQDIVPNHMAFDSENRMLVDVLENGQYSRYFHFFDIDWNHPYESIKGRILAPFLGKTYGEVLEEGKLMLRYQREGFSIRYYNLTFPLRIESYVSVLTYRLDELKQQMGRDNPHFINLLGVLYVLQTLESQESASERYDQITFIKRMLWELFERNEDIRRFIGENVRLFCGQSGHPESFDHLDNLLYDQFFRLSFWKVATEEINYRRFFSLNELICLRMEDRDVFDQGHLLVFQLIDDSKIAGLRIDHVDGLYDPAAYLERVRERSGDRYILVEKILRMDEELPSSWPVQGTTGYDFMNYLNGLFCMRRNEKKFSKVYSHFTGLKTPYENLMLEKKRLIIEKHMGGDVDNLALVLKSVSARDRYGRDITLSGLRRALVEVLVSFPVYRTYIRNGRRSEKDVEYIETTMKKAVQNNPGMLKEFDFINRFLVLEPADYLSEEEKTNWNHFIMRFQQFTGPLMAKGFEDTTLYVYNRLLSLNEVGGDPSRFGVSVEAFHHFNEIRNQKRPHSMNATSTHDTKRGEDVRARINVLSEMPDEWRMKLKSWGKINRRAKSKVKGLRVPDTNDEYFLYQTLMGAFPFSEKIDDEFIHRVKEYAVKSVREAKVHTAWLQADRDYENAYLSFISKILDTARDNVFLNDFISFQRKISRFGIFNGLSQTLLKITCPGVPDFYQGTEMWDLNLVDPDNRRPVDFKKRIALLKYIQERSRYDSLELVEELMGTKEDGRIKFFLIYKALKVRKELGDLFRHGRYIPLQTRGKFQDHVIAFARNRENKWAVAIASRFLAGLMEDEESWLGEGIWQDTAVLLPENAPRVWTDRITDQPIEEETRLSIGKSLRHLPATLLIGCENGTR